MPKYEFQCGRRAGRLGMPKNHLQKRKHVGFWVEVDGQLVHMLGDLHMSEETLDAVKEITRAAMRMLEKKAAEIEDEE